MRNGEPRFVEQHKWTEHQTDLLAEYISLGWSFEQAGRKLKRSKNSCISRFRNVIARQFGWQAE